MRLNSLRRLLRHSRMPSHSNVWKRCCPGACMIPVIAPHSNKRSQEMRPISSVLETLNKAMDREFPQSSEIPTAYNPTLKPLSELRAKENGRKYAARKFGFFHFCVACGANATERHHKDGDPTNNHKDNVVQLCTPCHQLAHGKYPRRGYERPQSTTSWAWRNPYPL